MFHNLSNEARALKSEDVNIILALGHSGYKVDKQIAKHCPLVDAVIGGHTHTYLPNNQTDNNQPFEEKIEGPYPTIVVQKSGKKVPVVQAYAFTKYMGVLELKVKYQFKNQSLHSFFIQTTLLYYLFVSV